MNALADEPNVFWLDALRPVVEGRSRPIADRCQEPRFICRERLFVQVVLCPEHPELVGRTQAGLVVDVWASGIRYYCARPLPVGTLVDIWVEISSRPGKFFLSGKVRWSDANATDSHGIGIELEEGPATDIKDWRAMMR